MQTNIRGPEIIKRPSEGGTSRNRIINKSPFSRGQNQYSTPSERHLVYDRLLSALEDRQILDPLTQQVIPALPARTALAMRAEGITPLEIELEESVLLDRAEQMTGKYLIQRAAPKALAAQFRKDGREEKIFERRIVAIPGRLLNAVACGHLLTLFPRELLLRIPGFFLKSFEDEEGYCESIRLDLEHWMSRRGFLIPKYENGLIGSLTVFRYPEDRRPFTLRTRSGEVPLSA